MVKRKLFAVIDNKTCLFLAGRQILIRSYDCKSIENCISKIPLFFISEELKRSSDVILLSL